VCFARFSVLPVFWGHSSFYCRAAPFASSGGSFSRGSEQLNGVALLHAAFGGVQVL
jgi:hypothetical protein